MGCAAARLAALDGRGGQRFSHCPNTAGFVNPHHPVIILSHHLSFLCPERIETAQRLLQASLVTPVADKAGHNRANLVFKLVKFKSLLLLQGAV